MDVIGVHYYVQVPLSLIMFARKILCLKNHLNWLLAKILNFVDIDLLKCIVWILSLLYYWECNWSIDEYRN